MREFNAYAFALSKDEDVQAMVLAEREDGSGQRLEIQRHLAPNDQDRGLGHDTYALADDRGAVHYGGIETWAIQDDLLEIRLNKETSDALGVHGGYRIRLKAIEAAAVVNGLQTIVGGETT